jgi:hypothetical protein
MQTVWELETKESTTLPETTHPEVTSLSSYLETSTMNELESYLTAGEGAEPYHASNRDEEIYYMRDFLLEKNQGEFMEDFMNGFKNNFIYENTSDKFRFS